MKLYKVKYNSNYLNVLINIYILESLLIVNGLGLQIDIKYVVGTKSTYIPIDIIKDSFINEVISRVSLILLI